MENKQIEEVYFGWGSDGKEGGSDGKEGSKDSCDKGFMPCVEENNASSSYLF